MGVVKERAGAVIALSSEQGFPFWLPLGMMVRGGALAEQRQEEDGIQQIQQGMATMRGQGMELYRPYYLALLAEAYSKVGQAAEGCTTLTEALAIMNKTGERWCEAELYRLRGELTLQQQFKVQSSEFKVPSPQHLALNAQAEVEQEAEECFLKAIEIAQRQQAKSLELRAAMSLSRLWQQQGKKKEAHERLSEIYGWFTEGFDTADLKDAQALLEELSEGGRYETEQSYG
jgi:predicted ATPase